MRTNLLVRRCDAGVNPMSFMAKQIIRPRGMESVIPALAAKAMESIGVHLP
jgi:hypothetical protein